MKPIEVEFQAFGPYSGKEKVNFEKLSSKGLFLICGNTGSGKTTILDAMTFALYGKSSTGARDDFASMRCTNAEFDTATFVKFCFESNGVRYVFERRLNRKKKNLSASYNAAVINEEGIYKPLFENAKEKALNEAAARIIGLEYEQFRQVVVLPQGQFEKFLTAASDEKEKILTSIFGEEKWRYIIDNFYEEASLRKDELKLKKQKIENSLCEENCAVLFDLTCKINGKIRNRDRLEKEYVDNDYEEQGKILQEQLAVCNRFDDLDKTDKKLMELNSLSGIYEEAQIQVNNINRALKVLPGIDEKDTARSNFDKRIKEYEQIKCQTADINQRYIECEEKLVKHLEMQEENKEKNKLRIELEAKRNVYEKIEEVRSDYKKAVFEEKICTNNKNSIQKSFEQLLAEVKEAKSTFDKSNSEHIRLMNEYLAGITGEIASTLVAGQPCPVCGSVDHPHKAIVSDNAVSKEMVDDAKSAADEAYRQLQVVTGRQEEEKKQFDLISAELIKKHDLTVTLSVKLEEMTSALESGIDSLEMLNEKINSLSLEVEEYNRIQSELINKKESLHTEYAQSLTRETTAKSEREEAESLFEDANKTLQTALITNDFSSEDEVRGLLVDKEKVVQMQQEINEYNANLKAVKENQSELRQELSDIDRPDKEEIHNKLETIQNAHALYAQNVGVLSNEIDRLSKKLKMLEEEGSGLEERIRQAEEDFAFAKKLRGDSGTGLQRYVLGVMFSSVIASANKMLELVHDGRYRLYRSDDKNVGNKRGLELKVFDKNSEEHEGRFVNTLSGGEKFLVSLALSIGMSNIASKGGIKIEALFIDEGFGSLDEDSISDAMDILNTIQKANGTVGIISHVGLLQDRIGTKLKIVENKSGSHIVETIG